MSLLDIDSADAGKDAHLALARKWRPRRFAEVVGQDHAVRTLRNALSSGRLHHAYMFTGTRGIGKTTLARILAKSFNCDAVKDGEPCCECASCAGVDSGTHPDVIEMDAASTTQVDSMRELLDSANYAPASARFKVYIIDEVHMLSRHSFNAMLKTLEEPPGHIKFILATTDPQQVPATVQSRCLRFSLRRLPRERIAAHLAAVLKEEGIKADAEALSLIASQSDGSVRDSLSVLEEAIASEGEPTAGGIRGMLGLAGVESVPRLVGLVLSGDAKGALDVASEMHELGANLDTALAGMQEAVHRGQLARHSHALGEEVDGSLRDIDPVKAQLVYEVAGKALERLPAAPDPKVAFDMALLRMAALFEGAGGSTGGKDAAAPARPAEPAKPASKEQGPDGEGGDRAHNYREESALDRIPGSEEEWVGLARRLGDDRVKALADRCKWLGSGERSLRLGLAKEHKGQLAYEGKLSGEINERVGAEVELAIEVLDDDVSGTPGEAKRDDERRQRELLAKEAEGSEVLKKIRGTFPDSKVIVDGIRPKEA